MGRGQPLLDDSRSDDHLTCWYLRDVTDERRGSRSLHRAQVRAQFLAEAGRALHGVLNLERTLRTAASLAVGTLAPTVLVLLADSSETVRWVRGDDAARPVSGEMARTDLRSTPRLYEAMTGDVPVDPWVAVELADLPVWAAGPPSGHVTVVPVPGTVVRGVLVLVNDAEPTPDAEDGLPLAQEYAVRVGTALSAAALYREQAHLGEVLQGSLEPPPLPENVDGLVLGSAYRPARESLRVGGDFYEVLPVTAAGETPFLLGDVCGKGIEAAVLSGRVRQSLHALRLVEREPVALLALLNEALLDAADLDASGASVAMPRFATMVLGDATPTSDGSVLLRLATGGHPPPYVLRTDGTAEEVPVSGTLVGALRDAEFGERRGGPRPRGHVACSTATGSPRHGAARGPGLLRRGAPGERARELRRGARRPSCARGSCSWSRVARRPGTTTTSRCSPCRPHLLRPEERARERTHANATDLGAVRDDYLDRLAASDEAGAVAVALAALDAGNDPEAVLLDVVAEAQREVGSAGRLRDVERRAGARRHAHLRAGRGRGRPRPPGARPVRHRTDRRRVPRRRVARTAARLLAEVLTHHGWEVTFLGRASPASQIAVHLNTQGPDVVAVSSSAALPAARGAPHGGGVPGDRHPDPRRWRGVRSGRALGACGGRRRLGPRRPLRRPPARGRHPWPATMPPSPSTTRPARSRRCCSPGAGSWRGLVGARLREGSVSEELADDLGHLVDFLAAAVYVDDPSLLARFLRWVGSVTVPHGLSGAEVEAAIAELATRLGDSPRTVALLRSDAVRTAAIDAREGTAEGSA